MAICFYPWDIAGKSIFSYAVMMSIDNNALRELCETTTRSPQSVAFSFRTQEAYRQDGEGDVPWAGVGNRLRAVGDTLEEGAAERAGMKDDLLQIRRRKEMEAVQERSAAFAAAEFLERVGQRLGSEPDWTIQDFSDQLPQYEDVALEVAQEKEMSLPDLYRAVMKLVSECLTQSVETKVMDLNIGSLRTFEKWMGGRQKYVHALVEEVFAGKERGEQEKMETDVRAYYLERLRSILQ
jgi:hypothetical protein